MQSFTATVAYHYERSCFCYLTSNGGKNATDLRDFMISKDGSKPLYIRAYAWPNSSSENIVINSIFGAKNVLFEGDKVLLSPLASVTPLYQVELSPESTDDWDIFESNAHLLESSLLDQLPLVCDDVIYPVWAQSLCLFAKARILNPACTFGILTEGTEIHVVPVISSQNANEPYSQQENHQSSQETSNPIQNLDTIDPKLPLNELYYLKTEFSSRILPKHFLKWNDGKNGLLPPECGQINLAFCLLRDICIQPELFAAFYNNKTVIVEVQQEDDTPVLVELYPLSSKTDAKFVKVYDTLQAYPNHLLVHNSFAKVLKSSVLTWICMKPVCTSPAAINKAQLIIGLDETNKLTASTEIVIELITSWINTVSTATNPLFIPASGIYLDLPIGQAKIEPASKEDLKIFPFAEIEFDIAKMAFPEFKDVDLGFDEKLADFKMDVQPYESIANDVLRYCMFCLDIQNKGCKPIGPSNILLEGKLGSEVDLVGKQILTTLYSSFLVYSEKIECKFWKGKKVESIEKLLSKALKQCEGKKPAVLLLDDLDTLCTTLTEANPEMNFHLNKLAACMRRLFLKFDVLVVGTVSDVHKLHPDLRHTTGSRCFTKIFKMPALNKADRTLFMKKIVEDMEGTRCHAEVIEQVAALIEGYTVADLRKVTQHTVMNRLRKETLSTLDLSIEDWKCSLDAVTPMRLHSARLHHTDATKDWDHVGGMKQVKEQLEKIFVWPAKYPDVYCQVGIRLTRGALLYGPSGCGKTLIASVLAQKCNMNIISVKGPELMSKYIGASEEAVRDLFSRAESAKPCLLFFDEFDSLAPRRGHDSTGVTDRVVNQLLTQLDGIESLDGVYLIAACSRPDLIDPALLRPGRIDKSIYCGLPDKADRLEILERIGRALEFSADVILEDVAEVTSGRSGADLKAVLTDGHINAVHRVTEMEQDTPVIINNDDLVHALEALPPLKELPSRIYETTIEEEDFRDQRLSLA